MNKIVIFTLILICSACGSTYSVKPTKQDNQKSWYSENDTPMHVTTAWQGAEGAKKLIDDINLCSKVVAGKQSVGGVDYVQSTKCYLSILTDSDTEMFYRDLNASADVQAPIVSSKNEGRNYEISMQWSKHTWIVEPEKLDAQQDLNIKDNSIYKIGIGVNIVAKIYNVSTGLDLTNLPALAFQLKASESRGTISFNRIGINGKVTELIFPGVSKELSPESLAQALDGLQKIQILLYSDEDIVLKPSVLGYKLPESEVNIDENAGWLYLGHYSNAESALQMNIVEAENSSVGNLIGKTITINADKSLRIDRPRFPYYSIPAEKQPIKTNCQLKVEQLANVGLNKYWALVSKLNKDICDNVSGK
ncbi:hypothetical protein [Shewanella sp. HN-41]|uniref:hypothetical protein n=1 Tax=Shewanella sp. HN-41 TaxID=327275 RepID=UPI0002125E2E|nr:hypothetical protein [Shewanella sp. HN-41]EGM68592.1 hypothetical protein SOHN41_03264 [Shewanella sp. HN-41]